jgi:transposase
MAAKKPSKSLGQVNPDAAGIDVGSESHFVAVPADRDGPSVREFSAFTDGLNALADWLVHCGIKTVAMEATGVYWIALFQVLDARGLEVILVNARHVKNVPGRKSDVQDCQWLQRLHSHGLLSGSFRPQDDICVLRSYVRQRDALVKSAGTHIQRMQKALDQMNIKLHKVVRDITGETGMRIIKAIIAGERDPQKLASLKDYRVRASTQQIARALQGDFRPEHLFALQQEMRLYEVYRSEIATCEAAIREHLASFEDRIDPSDDPGPTRGKRADLRRELHRMAGVDFTAIDGLDVLTVLTIISEVGRDVSKWRTEKHFASWLALCPRNKVTGGKVKSSKTQPSTNRAANAFRMAAWALANSKSALGAYYRRMRSRLGAPKAITATAHKLARIFYRLLKHGHTYVDPGLDYYEQRYSTGALPNWASNLYRQTNNPSQPTRQRNIEDLHDLLLKSR